MVIRYIIIYARLTSILHRITLSNLTVSIQCIVKNSVIHLKKIGECKCTSLYYDLVTETRKTYGSIFSKMLADIEATIKSSTTSYTDIEGIKNFAKINGDFDENYKAEIVDNSVCDTDEVLTSTTSAVENSAKNYAASLARAYEKISQYKEENTQLTKELEKCRAEAKKTSCKKYG